MIRDQQRSGLAVRAFYGREGLKDWTFRWWRQELGRRGRQTSEAPEMRKVVKPTEPVTSAMFVPSRRPVDHVVNLAGHE